MSDAKDGRPFWAAADVGDRGGYTLRPLGQRTRENHCARPRTGNPVQRHQPVRS